MISGDDYDADHAVHHPRRREAGDRAA